MKPTENENDQATAEACRGKYMTEGGGTWRCGTARATTISSTVAAFIVVNADMPASEDEIIGCCSRELANVKVPGSLIFADTIPRTPTGKILKRELRERFAGWNVSQLIGFFPHPFYSSICDHFMKLLQQYFFLGIQDLVFICLS